MSQEPREKMGQDRLAEGKENKPAAAAEPAKKRTVPSGVLWFTVGNSMQAGTTVLMTMLTGYVLDLASVGIFSFALMASQLLYTVGLFGANDLQMTDYDHRYRFGDYFKVKVVSTLTAMLICFILPGVLGLHGRKMACLFLLTTYMLINSAAELYQSMLFQAQRLDLSGKMLFFRMTVSLAGFAVVILIKRSLLQACAVLLSVNFAATCFSVRRWCGAYRDSPCILRDGKEKELFIESFPLCLSVLGFLLNINAPKFLINYFLTDEIQGIYTILFMPVYAVNLISQFIFKPYLIKYARNLEKQDGSFEKLLLSQTLFIGLCAVTAAFGMWLLGPWLLKLLFSKDLTAYRGWMGVFMVSGGLMALNQLCYYLLVLLKRQKMILANYSVGIIVSFTAGIAVIPHAGIMGTWLAFTLGQTSLLAGYGMALRSGIKKRLCD